MFKVSGRGGSSSSSSKTYVPYEAENSLQSNTQARLLEFICSGRIKGPAIGDSWAKSLFLNETPVVSEDGTENFQGVTVAGRLGTSDQNYITGHGAIEIETDMLSVDVTQSGGPIAHSIVNGDIDDLRITLQWPYMVTQTDKGDLETTSVAYRITVTPDGGSGAEQTAIEKTLSGKCVSTYRNQHTIKNIAQYGVSPWVVRVYRITADAADSKTKNTMQWYSYTEITNAKMRHPNTAFFGLIFDSKLFGDTLPSRALYIYGCDEIEYPANFNPETGEYTGIWDGETWETGWTDSAPWILRYLITNETNGLGLPESYVNKWFLYTVGQFSDEHIEHTRRYRQPNGTYATETITRPRFSFNGVIQDRGQALKVISNLASVFMGFPVWSSGEVSFVNDMPKDVTRIACPANVKDGFFEYGPGAEKSARTTVVNVSYNDPDNFGRLTTYPVQDDDSIKRYGYNTSDITAIGCNNAAEAIYRARHHLRTNNIQTDPISFIGGKEWADLEPGEIIGVQDPNYADVNLSGRIAGSTTTSITVDRDVEIESGVTYTLIVPLSDIEGSVERTLTNTPGTTRELTWETAMDYAPNVALPWVLSSSSVAIRKFMALGAEEKDDGSYEVSGWEYDENKWDIIENGIIVDDPPDTTISSGAMSPPSGINIQTYTYTEGDHNIRKYGMLISWEKSTDTRLSHYRIIASKDGGGWYSLDGGDTAKTSYDYKSVTSGDYSFAVQAIGVASQSTWVYYNDFTLNVGLNAPEPPTNLRCVDNPTQSYFTGKDCEIAWDASIGAEYTPDGSDDAPFTTADAAGDANVAGYKIEVYDGLTLVRTAYTEGKTVLSWSYTFQMNGDDNGEPIRNINFRVYTLDVSGVESETYESLSASNPLPSLATSTPTIVEYGGGISVSWPLVDDNDMLGYSIEVDGSAVAFINHPGNTHQYTNVEFGTYYDFEIIPYDEFGAGTGSLSATGSPVKIPGVNVDVELSGTITMSDSDGNTAETMSVLYDGLISAGGVSYTVAGTDKYIEYSYSLTNYFDRVSVCTSDANGQVYFAFSDDGTTWTWLKAQTDHSLDSEGKLVSATDQADAATNYWQLDAGQNIALFPNRLVAKKVRLYFTGSYSTTIFEFVPARILISELGAISELSVITENCGRLRAGRIESNDGGSYWDLDNGMLVVGSGQGSIHGNSITAGTVTATQIGANEIISSSANLGNAVVNTLKIKNQAVTIPVSTNTSSTKTLTSTSSTLLLSLTIASTGSPITVMISCYGYNTNGDYANALGVIIKRGSTTLRTAQPFIFGDRAQPTNFILSDTPGAGNHTYYIYGYNVIPSFGNIIITNRYIGLLETKK
jgi:predicted phage tail protein